MYMCTCVSKEGGDGEDAGSEVPSLMSYTLGCTGKHTVNLVLVVSQQETVVLVRHLGNQST